MALKILTDIPCGNARSISVRKDGDMPEVLFAVNPKGGEALWFCFRLVNTTPAEAHPAKVRLTLKHFDTLSGISSPAELLPVYRPADQGWHRMSAGVGSGEKDGRTRVSWSVPYPSPSLDIAFCFPYGRDELRSLQSKSKGYWRSDEIGLSPSGRSIVRISNDYGKPGGHRHGLYLIARQRPGETSGSWVLDGTLRYLSRGRRDPFLTWCTPLADVDGIVRGRFGGDAMPCGMDQAWTTPAMRHDCHVLQGDIARWKGRCRPTLAIDFCAAPASETGGLFCVLPPAEANAELHKAAGKWANVIRQELGPDLAAQDFSRGCTTPTHPGNMRFDHCMTATHGLCALTVAVPCAKIGTTVLSQKHYRDIGERIARALVKRGSGG
jgi:hypothetical protein